MPDAAGPGIPRVTVVVPAYNCEAFLVPAGRSVLMQGMDALHLVIVDDGSTDRTPWIATAFAEEDPRVRVLRQENGGTARARNVGCAASPLSPYVAFLDADDSWDPTKLQVQLAFLDSAPHIVGVGSYMRYVSSTGRILGRTGQEVSPEDVDRVARAELLPFPISSLVLRRTALDQTGPFDESFRHPGAEDLEFYSRLARCGPIACIPTVLGSYRIHPGSAMARERLRINREARFVRHRLAARDAGGDLSWEAFLGAYRPTWRERRQDLVEVLYRTAGLSLAENRRLRALCYGALATLIDPWYTLRRVRHQRSGV
jgi:glycosyltransferase involved in cell wall biosynthesis